MIKKILVRDYLKGYGDMTAEERKAFVGRVGEWLAQDGARLLAMTDRPMAKSQSLMTITTRWSAEDCKAMTDGIMLMSALVGVADTWLPTQIYMKSAYRAVRQVVAILSEIPQGTERGGVGAAPELSAMGAKTVTRGVGKTSETAARLQGKGWQGHLQPVPAMKKLPKAEQMTKHPGIEKGSGVALQPLAKSAVGAGAGKPQALPSSVGATASPGSRRQGGDAIATQQTKKEYQPSAISHQPSSGMVPARPKHIDQYVHLLPKATQERAGEYGELMRQLGEARDNMQLLMDDDHASAKSREQWAKQATRIDKKIRALREELDREWEKVAVSGRVAIDDLGMAHLVSTSQCDAAQNGDGTGADGEGGEREPVELTSEQKKRRRDLRKWLIDLRRGKEGKDREKRIEQWRVNWQEYLTLEPKEKALEDEKILEAAKHFGIDLEMKNEE
jgi:hypothetical protein